MERTPTLEKLFRFMNDIMWSECCFRCSSVASMESSTDDAEPTMAAIKNTPIPMATT